MAFTSSFFKDVKFTCKGKLVFTSVRFSISFNNNLKAETNKSHFLFVYSLGVLHSVTFSSCVFLRDQVTKRA